MITIQDLFWLIPSASVLALVFAGVFFYRMKAQDEGNEVMRMIAKHVRSGAMAYLRQQYKIVAIFFVLITVVSPFWPTACTFRIPGCLSHLFPAAFSPALPGISA